jgi:hypothetical protein
VKWPRKIVEIPAPSRDDARADPMATQKISAKQLEEALRRTKSGFRRAVRESKPEIEESDPRTEPSAEVMPELEPEPPPIPDPIITVKPDPTPLDPIVIAMIEDDETQPRGTPIPRTKNHVITPSMSMDVAPPPSRRMRIVLAFVVAFLTTTALGIGYLLGRGH